MHCLSFFLVAVAALHLGPARVLIQNLEFREERTGVRVYTDNIKQVHIHLSLLFILLNMQFEICCVCGGNRINQPETAISN